MISSFPWGDLIFFGSNFYPIFSVPVQNIDWVKSLFISSSTSKDNNLIVFFIIVHGTIGSLNGDISKSLYLSPLHSYWIEGPKVVHVGWISISTKEYNFFSDYATTVSPSGWRPMRWGWKGFYLMPCVLIHFISFRNKNFFGYKSLIFYILGLI